MNEKEMLEIYNIASTITPCNKGNCGKCRIRCTYSEYRGTFSLLVDENGKPLLWQGK